MSEKSTFTKPLSLAIGKATGVFSRPKLQRRALTAQSATELLSAATLTNALLQLKADTASEAQLNSSKEAEADNNEEENGYQMLTVKSPRLRATTWHGSGDATPRKTEQTSERRSSDTLPTTQNTTAEKTLEETLKEQTIQATFRGLKVKEMIEEVLSTHLENLEYNHKLCSEKGRLISQAIEKNVKSLHCSQFKVTALVFIGAIRDMGIELASQCTWSPGTDYFAMATFKNETVFASGIAFATSFD